METTRNFATDNRIGKVGIIEFLKRADIDVKLPGAVKQRTCGFADFGLEIVDGPAAHLQLTGAHHTGCFLHAVLERHRTEIDQRNFNNGKEQGKERREEKARVGS